MGNDIKKAVTHVAGLARLELDESKLAKYTENVTKIIEYFHKLNELDTKDVPPTSHAIDVVSILREDKIEKFKDVKGIMNEAPEKDGPFVQVPKVI